MDQPCGTGDYTTVCSMMVKPHVRRANLAVRVALATGTMAWSLRDPNGHVRGEGQARPGAVVQKEVEYETPDAGNWRMEIKTQDATGQYSTRWIVAWDQEEEFIRETYVQKYIGPA